MLKVLIKCIVGILILTLNYDIAYAENNEITTNYAEIDSYVEKEMEQCRIPGFALGIVKNNEIIYLKGYGYADSSGREVTPQTPFLIASLSKSFTAMAIMQLVDEQKLDLDKPVQTYIPWFRVSDLQASSEITVRQLLNHTSGIGADAEYEIATLRGDDTNIEQFVRKMSKIKLTKKVGESFQYNNANYIILGQIIQSISGLSYENYMKQKVFQPLGMLHSYVSQDEAKKDGMAVGYRTMFGIPVPVELPYRRDFLPTYSIISCSEDISKYLVALLNNGNYNNSQVLSEQGVTELMMPSSKISDWQSYGLGWYVTSGSVYHGGEVTNYQSKAKMIPEDSLGVILMYNTSSSTLTKLFKSGYRDRIESGIISILYGYEPDEVQPGARLFDLNRYPMSATYSIYIILCTLIVMILVLSVIRLKSFKKRLVTGKKSSWRFVFIGLINFALPLYILFIIPESENFSWRFILYYVPDIGYFTLLTCIAALIIGIIKLVISYRLSASNSDVLQIGRIIEK
ncbi:MAG: beta-lactamase [Herbinix sp.]|nr:beta-lactamase [Herbinix sp.]